MIRRQFFAWYDAKQQVFRVSAYPPDAPVRPSRAFETLADLTEMMSRKRASVYWWPPLPANVG